MKNKTTKHGILNFEEVVRVVDNAAQAVFHKWTKEITDEAYAQQLRIDAIQAEVHAIYNDVKNLRDLINKK